MDLQPQQRQRSDVQSRHSTATDEALKELSKDSLQMRSNDPWVRKMPMEVLIPQQLETVATSLKTPPYKLLLTGRQILEFVQEAEGVPRETTTGHHAMTYELPKQHKIIGVPETANLMRIFTNIFKRIVETKFDPEDEANVKSFYSYVWSCHVEHKNDFSDTIVIHVLLDKYPEFLEMSLVESIKTSSPGSLVPLCEKHSHTFQILLKLLCQVFDYCNRHSRIMDFTTEFLRKIEEAFVKKSLDRPKSWQGVEAIRCHYDKYISMYPDIFHPILWFIANVNIQSDYDARVSLENSIVQDELLSSVDELIGLHSDDKSLILFFLASNSTIMQVINSTNTVGAITLSRYPFLWKQLHKTE